MDVPHEREFEKKRLLRVFLKDGKYEDFHIDKVEEIGSRDLEVDLPKFKRATVYLNFSGGHSTFSGPYAEFQNYTHEFRQAQTQFYEARKAQKKIAEATVPTTTKAPAPEPPKPSPLELMAAGLKIDLKSPFPTLDSAGITFQNGNRYHIDHMNHTFYHDDFGKDGHRVDSSKLQSLGMTSVYDVSELIRMAEVRGANFIFKGDGKKSKGLYYFYKLDDSEVMNRVGAYSVTSLKELLAKNKPEEKSVDPAFS